MKQATLQMRNNINSVDTSAKAVDNCMAEIRDGFQNRYEPVLADLTSRVQRLEQNAMEMRGGGPLP